VPVSARRGSNLKTKKVGSRLRIIGASGPPLNVLVGRRASVGSTEASNGRLARVGVVGPTYLKRMHHLATAADLNVYRIPDRLGDESRSATWTSPFARPVA
jgi:hypothetical protein